MEENREMRELIVRLERQIAKQNRYARWQCVMAAGCCVLLLVLAAVLLPKAVDLSARMETVMTNLESITAQLDEADLTGMVEDVDAMAVASQEGIDEAMGKLNAIDFETLNRAIENLADVVEPLAKFFNIFN